MEVYILAKNERGIYYASEKFPLKQIKCEDIVQVRENAIVVDIETETVIKVNDHQVSRKNLVPALGNLSQQEKSSFLNHTHSSAVLSVYYPKLCHL